MAKILIKNGTIWDGEKFFPGDVLTDGNYIAEIGENITQEANFVYDAKGKIVSPGLVDFDFYSKNITPRSLEVPTEACSFPFGVTAVNTSGGTRGDKSLLDALAVKNTVFVRVDIYDNHAILDRTDEMLERYGDKAIGVKIDFNTTTLQVADATALREVTNFAKKRGIKVMVHTTDSPTDMTTIASNLNRGDILTHAYHGGKNPCIDHQYECFYVAKRKGVVIDTGFAGYTHTDFAIFQSAVRAGFAPEIISTDITSHSAFRSGGRYGMTMCMSIALHAGMSEAEVFSACTSTPAKVLGKDKEWGYLKKGRVADIAVFEYADEGYDLVDNVGNHIQSDEGYRCVLTIADGQLVHRYK